MKLSMKQKKIKIKNKNRKPKYPCPWLFFARCYGNLNVCLRRLWFHAKPSKNVKNNRLKFKPPRPKDERKCVTCECHKSIEYCHHRHSNRNQFSIREHKNQIDSIFWDSYVNIWIVECDFVQISIRQPLECDGSSAKIRKQMIWSLQIFRKPFRAIHFHYNCNWTIPMSLTAGTSVEHATISDERLKR